MVGNICTGGMLIRCAGALQQGRSQYVTLIRLESHISRWLMSLQTVECSTICLNPAKARHALIEQMFMIKQIIASIKIFSHSSSFLRSICYIHLICDICGSDLTQLHVLRPDKSSYKRCMLPIFLSYLLKKYPFL